MKNKTENLRTLIKEHIHLERVLKTGKGRKQEARKQAKELSTYKALAKK